MSGNGRWPVLVTAIVATAGLAGCGMTPAPPADAGKAASISLALNTVPVIRSVTVSPAKATFSNCSGGDPANNTGSTTGKLGYPNGHCWYGKPEPGGSFPITISNTGIAAQIDVAGSAAYPADNGTEWRLCNAGDNPVVTCTGHDKSAPGVDQYLVVNFSPDNSQNAAGIADTPLCDHQFGQSGSCKAVQGSFQTEGLELIGPASTSDNSTGWTVTVTWMPVPP